MKKIICFLFLMLAGTAANAGKYLSDNDGSEKSKEYCLATRDIDQSSADNLSKMLEVQSDSIRVRKGVMSGICCVILDTPKGAYKRLVSRFYQSDSGMVFVGLSTAHYQKDSDDICSF